MKIRTIVEIVAGFATIASGGYLLLAQDVAHLAAGQGTWFSVIAHGLGGYMVGRGLWMLARAGGESDIIDRLNEMLGGPPC